MWLNVTFNVGIFGILKNIAGFANCKTFKRECYNPGVSFFRARDIIINQSPLSPKFDNSRTNKSLSLELNLLVQNLKVMKHPSADLSTLS